MDEQEQTSVTLEEAVGGDERCEAEETVKLRLSKTQILDDSPLYTVLGLVLVDLKS